MRSVSPIRREGHFSRKSNICKGIKGKGPRRKRCYQYILVELKHRTVSDEAGKVSALMPGYKHERSRASLWPSGMGWRGPTGRLERESELRMGQRGQDGTETQGTNGLDWRAEQGQLPGF